MELAGEHNASWLGITWSLALEVQVTASISLTLMVAEGGFAAFLLLPGLVPIMAAPDGLLRRVFRFPLLGALAPFPTAST
jgi:hypothetical protein